jgi:glycosyltransferase involved in cell wall biosynthesis
LRILLIANYLPDQQESMRRFCELLKEGLTARGEHVQVLRPQPWFSRLPGRSPAIQKWLGYLDKYVLFPFVLFRKAKSYDMIHILDHSNSVYTPFLQGKPNVVTCHDLLAVRSALGEISENRTGLSGRVLQRAILSGLKKAQFVVCVSEQTEREVLRLSGRGRDVTSCVHNALNYPYRPMDPDEAGRRLHTLLGRQVGPFFLHVGGNQWYKNRAGVLEIFVRLHSLQQFSRHRLVMVGQPFTDALRSFIRSKGVADEVLELTELPNENLRALYSLAEGLIFASLAEGFGWPIVEAQACGCPVFTSNRAPMNEIGGDAAVYFDPLHPQAAAEAIATSLTRRKLWVARSLENAKRFRVDDMLAAYREVYRRVFEGRS